MLNYVRIGNTFINLKNAIDIQVYTSATGTVIIAVDYICAHKEYPCGGTEDEIAATLEQALCVE